MPKPVTARLVASALALAIAAPLAALPAASLAQSARTQGDAQAEAFVSTEANRALGILGDGALGAEAKKRAFRQFVDDVADVPLVTGFVLGKYRRSITPAQYAEFAQVFRLYANSVYETRLGLYKGEKLVVTGSTLRRPGDVVVSSQVTGGAQRQAVVVNWRVIKNDAGQWKAVDVQVQGVWLAITQRQDFGATLDNNNGNIAVLISQLRSQGAGGSARRG